MKCIIGITANSTKESWIFSKNPALFLQIY